MQLRAELVERKRCITVIGVYVDGCEKEKEGY